MVAVQGPACPSIGGLRRRQSQQRPGSPVLLLLHDPRKLIMSRYSDAIKILGPKVHETIRTTPVLVVGAGGIGSELRASCLLARRVPRLKR